MRILRALLFVAIALVATVFGARAATHAANAPPAPATVGTPAPRVLGSGQTGHLIPLPGRTPPPPGTSTAQSGSIPHPPPPPRTVGRVRHIRSASGADIILTFGAGCSGAYPNVIPVNCQITWKPVNVPANSHDCWYAPGSVNAIPASGGSCQTAPTGVTYAQTLSVVGTYIFGSFNSTTNVWDELVYLTVGATPAVQTYADAGLTIPQSTFLPNGSTTVYVGVTGLNNQSRYVIDISESGLRGACVFEIGGITTNRNLCNPAASGGAVLPSFGALSVGYTPAANQQNDTYTVEVFDFGNHIRVATRQFALSSTVSTIVTTFVPSSTAPSPAPAFTTPPFADLGTFAYDGNDASVSKVTIKTTGAALTKTYERTITDPNGVLVGATTPTSDASGNIADFLFPFAAAQTPSNFIANTYTYMLYDPVAKNTVYSKSFQISGYAMQAQFSAPYGTALTISGGTATSNVQFFNSGDLAYGLGLGDPIQYVEVKSANDGTTFSLNCGSFCTSESVSDTAGNTWTATVTNALGIYRLFLTPQNNALAVGATLTLPNMIFTNAIGCGTAGCKLTTSFVPQHGVAWTDPTKGATNPLYLVYDPGTTLTATGTMVLVGREGHNYITRSTQAIYAYNQPFAQTAKPIYKYTIVNTSSGSGAAAIANFKLTMPSGFPAATATVTAGGASGWALDPVGCASAGSNVVCFKHSIGAGIASGGGTDFVSFSINSPNTAFSYTDVLGEVTAPVDISIVAALPQATVFVGSSLPQNVDSTALAVYSLDSTKMQSSLSPPTVTGGTTAFTLSFTNTATSQDPFPEYIDALVFEFPTAQGLLSAISTNNLAFSYEPGIDTTASDAGPTVDRFWFGVCGAQRASGEPQKLSVTPCSPALEQNSIPPGGAINLYFSYTINSGGNQYVLWAHGANSGGWTALPFTVTSTATATGGFQQVGPYGAPVALVSGSQPTIGLDTNAAFGNSFVYRFTNTSGGNVPAFRVRLPGKDSTAVNGTDTESTPANWNVTNVPTLTSNDPLNNAYKCTVTNTTNPTTAGNDGQILIAGAACAIPAGGYVDVNFAMKAPYNPNKSFTFTPEYSTGGACAALPGTCGNTAAAQWTTDDSLFVAVAANISITVNPTAFNGTTPTVSCGGCTFGAGLIDFGTIVSDNATHTYSDVVRVDVTTTAAGSPGWKIYESVATNPTNTSGAPTNELQALIDGAVSSPITGGALTYTLTSTVLPSAGNGATMGSTAAANARRNPFSLINSFSLNVAAGDALGARTPAVTYTFIAN